MLPQLSNLQDVSNLALQAAFFLGWLPATGLQITKARLGLSMLEGLPLPSDVSLGAGPGFQLLWHTASLVSPERSPGIHAIVPNHSHEPLAFEGFAGPIFQPAAVGK